MQGKVNDEMPARAQDSNLFRLGDDAVPYRVSFFVLHRSPRFSPRASSAARSAAVERV